MGNLISVFIDSGKVQNMAVVLQVNHLSKDPPSPWIFSGSYLCITLPLLSCLAQLMSVRQDAQSHLLSPALQHLSPSSSPLHHPLSLPPSLPPSLNWESGRAVEIALTRALPECAIHLLFYYAAPGLPGRCRSICHRPRSLITGICHRLASLLMLSSPP